MRKILVSLFTITALSVVFNVHAESTPVTDKLVLVDFANKLLAAEPLRKVSKMKDLGSNSSAKEYNAASKAAKAAGEYCLQAAEDAPNPHCKKYATLAAAYYNGFGAFLKGYATYVKSGSKGDVADLQQLEAQYNDDDGEFDGFVAQLENGGSSQIEQTKAEENPIPAKSTVPSTKPVETASGSNQSGPPQFVDTEVTGRGATEDEAFKQAVVEAVRSVVGTLVTAENVVSNDEVIKDKVLTLSNGFVEKVLEQKQKKLDDGTYEVALKCTVRKGQLYGKLKEANVPTVKFEGVSMFADVVSQVDFKKKAVAMLTAIMGEVLSESPSFYVFEPSKPKIITAAEDYTDVEIEFSVRVDHEQYAKDVAPKVCGLLQKIASGDPEKITIPISSSENVYHYFSLHSSNPESRIFTQISSDTWLGYNIGSEVKSKATADFPSQYHPKILIIFEDKDGKPVLAFNNHDPQNDNLSDGEFDSCLFVDDDHCIGLSPCCTHDRRPVDKLKQTVRIPTSLLPAIASVKVRYGLLVDWEEFSWPTWSPRSWPYLKDGWFVKLGEGQTPKIMKGFSPSGRGQATYFIGLDSISKAREE